MRRIMLGGLKLFGVAFVVVAVIVLGALGGYTAVQKLAGLSVAVAQGVTAWNNLLDVGPNPDNNASGIAGVGLQAYDGTLWHAVRGDPVDGIRMDLRGLGGVNQAPADSLANPTTSLPTTAFNEVWDSVAAAWFRMKSMSAFLFTGNAATGVQASSILVGDRAVGVSADAWIGKNGRGGVIPSQATGGDPSNRRATAVNAEIVQSVAATANQRGMVHKMAARCSAGASIIRIESPNGTILWDQPVGTTQTDITFPSAWAGAVNTEVRVELGACGAGNTGTLMSQTSIY